VKYLPYYTEKEKLRHSVRPGITGLAQINGRNTLNWNDRLNYDIEYVENMSIILDIRILYLTALKVIKSENIVIDPESIMKNLDDERKRNISES
jgi:lipopolysaccharide/colanic/teichoic acid biosynthesis glycosyltransferase